MNCSVHWGTINSRLMQALLVWTERGRPGGRNGLRGRLATARTGPAHEGPP